MLYNTLRLLIFFNKPINIITMLNLKNKRSSFSLMEMIIYIALFTVLTGVLYNVFGNINNINRLAKKQNESVPNYNPAIVRVNLPFSSQLPSDLTPLPSPELPLPPDKPVFPEPGPGSPGYQTCMKQLQLDKCYVGSAITPTCYVCKCDEVACNKVTGCGTCHQA